MIIINNNKCNKKVHQHLIHQFFITDVTMLNITGITMLNIIDITDWVACYVL